MENTGYEDHEHSMNALKSKNRLRQCKTTYSEAL